MARFVVQFNDAVNPAEAGKALYFNDDTNKQRIPVKVRLAVPKDFKKQYSPTITPTWAELAAGTKPELKGEEPRVNALVVEAATPLPVGKGWRLDIDPSFKNQSGTAAYTVSDALVWGSILDLGVKSIGAQTHFDSQNEIEIIFTKSMGDGTLKPEERAAAVQPFVKVEPPVENLKLEVSANAVRILGDFALNTDYHVMIKAGLPGADGLGLPAAAKEVVTFNPSNAFVSTTATVSNQLATGNGVFDIYGANFKDLKVRVKQLTDAQLLEARELYEATYDRFGDDKDKVKKITDTPYEKFPRHSGL
ncbi:MAG: hypothetical protein QM796_21375 [Chthoniobacteraceae bacterium]